MMNSRIGANADFEIAKPIRALAKAGTKVVSVKTGDQIDMQIWEPLPPGQDGNPKVGDYLVIGGSQGTHWETKAQYEARVVRAAPPVEDGPAAPERPQAEILAELRGSDA